MPFSYGQQTLIENSYVGLQKRMLQTISSTAEERYELFTETYAHLSNRLPQTQITAFLGITPEFLSNSSYESIYFRPTNARSEDQLRRNHSIQYYAYPDYKFDKLRKDTPELYESYTDMELNKWISFRIEVKDNQAKLYLDNREQPSIFVNTPKNEVPKNGGIGLWVDIGTEGYFTDLKIVNKD